MFFFYIIFVRTLTYSVTLTYICSHCLFQICQFVRNGQREIMDPNKGVPHLVIKDEWIGYDNAESTKQKVTETNKGYNLQSPKYDC